MYTEIEKNTSKFTQNLNGIILVVVISILDVI